MTPDQAHRSIEPAATLPETLLKWTTGDATPTHLEVPEAMPNPPVLITDGVAAASLAATLLYVGITATTALVAVLSSRSWRRRAAVRVLVLLLRRRS